MRLHITENAFLQRFIRLFRLTSDNETVKEPYGKNKSIMAKYQGKRNYLQQAKIKRNRKSEIERNSDI